MRRFTGDDAPATSPGQQTVREYARFTHWSRINLSELSSKQEHQLRTWFNEYEGIGRYKSGVVFMHIEKEEDLIMCMLTHPFLHGKVTTRSNKGETEWQ